ncbi:hypothetical protein AMTR_s00076p00165800 [Amborella trichopoda]|uniref:Aminotransferase-like plant mobile domain-containing protein n=1 Tax=Amborella trichopoda TaxID=13333 RepID=W1PAU2_AMBTC|nr:hypothetical protein AMTR_s00076p00165800 [Amborella trichopoda]
MWYLEFFEDIEEADRYAWGAATLAYLYRSIRKAYTFKRRHVSGLATLMQVIWNPYFMHDEAILDDRRGYKAWYNRVSHPLIHNITNPPKDILQLVNQEEEEVVPAYERQYIMRPRGYEDQIVSAVQASTVMLAMALALRQK